VAAGFRIFQSQIFYASLFFPFHSLASYCDAFLKVQNNEAADGTLTGLIYRCAALGIDVMSTGETGMNKTSLQAAAAAAAAAAV